MAKQIYTEVDNSLSVAGAGDIVTGIVVVSDKGKVDTPVTIETESDLVAKYGNPNYKKSPTMYSALSYLQKCSGLVVARAIHTTPDGELETENNRTARYSSALIRGKVSPIPDTIPAPEYIPDRIVEPYKTQEGKGLTQANIDSFSFPVYPRERTYEKLANKVLEDNNNKEYIILNTKENLKIGSKLSFGDDVNDDSPYVEITNIEAIIAKYSKIKTDKPITATKGEQLRRVAVTPTEITNKVAAVAPIDSVEIVLDSVDGLESGLTIKFDNIDKGFVIQSVKADTKTITLRTQITAELPIDTAITLMKRDYYPYPADKTPTLLRSVSGSDEVLLSTNDLLAENDLVTFTTGITNYETEFTITGKGIYNEDQIKVSIDKQLSTNTDTIIQLMTNSEFEDRDVLLIYSDNQGEWGNKISVSILPSNDYPDTARIIKVFNNGIDTGEKFEVTFEDFVDGLGKQLFCESVINDKSEYIRVKHNPNMLDQDGNPILPLINDYSLWREEPTDIFTSAQVYTQETLTYGETDVRVNDFTDLSIGDRIKFGNYNEEYKITGKSSQEIAGVTEYHITIDRGIVPDSIKNGYPIYKFDHQEYKKVSKLEKQYPDYNINETMIIGGTRGQILDAGANKFSGGDNGSTPDVGDMIQCLNKVFSKREEIRVNILLSGGIYSPSYAQALDTLCQKREDCFYYLSNDPSNLDMTDAVKGTEDFRSSLNLNSRWGCLMADWGIAYDPYNKKDVSISVDGIAAALQSFAAQSGVWGVPVAGWSSGNTFYIKKLVKAWSEDEREKLLNAQINPCKTDKTRGISIWGNKTLYGSRSFMQARNVAFILIQMRIECRDYMESQHWKVNDSGSRAIMVNTLLDSFQKYMSVLNGLQIVDQTTAVDEDANQIKIYIGIQPKGIVEDIYVTLGVFNNSQGITIS